MITHGKYVMEQKYDKLGPVVHLATKPSSEHTKVCEVPVM